MERVRRSPSSSSALALLAAPAAGAGSRESWAKSAILTVTTAGLFPGKPATFRPADPLTAGDLAELLAAIGARPCQRRPTRRRRDDRGARRRARRRARPAPGRAPARRRRTRRRARPAPRFGTEVVARLLGLRTDLPSPTTARSCSPPSRRREPTPPSPPPASSRSARRSRRRPGPGADPGRRGRRSRRRRLRPLDRPDLRRPGAHAAAAGSAPHCRVADRLPVRLGRRGREGGARLRLLRPRLARVQARVLRRCAGPRRHDQGRTAAQMAAEIPRSERIRLADLQPGDVMFFGPKGRRSKAARSTTRRSTSATAG